MSEETNNVDWDAESAQLEAWLRDAVRATGAEGAILITLGQGRYRGDKYGTGVAATMGDMDAGAFMKGAVLALDRMIMAYTAGEMGIELCDRSAGEPGPFGSDADVVTHVGDPSC